MRAVGAVALALACLLVTVGLPVEAKPLPQTTNAVRTLVRDTLHDVDRDAAQALHEARQLVRTLRADASGLVPTAPAPNGALQMRASAVQPVVRGGQDPLSVAWIGAEGAPWVGAYWLEANGLARSPNLVSLDGEGGLFFLDPGVLPLPDSVDVTYRFLGVDGAQQSYHIGTARVLDLMPVEARAELGFAVATAGHEQDLLLFTPWNTLERTATLGVTYASADAVLAEYPIADCDDVDATSTSPGCRMIYLDLAPEELASLTLWHLDEAGARVVDLTLSMDQLLAGYVSDL